jgi:hypothetical protein
VPSPAPDAGFTPNPTGQTYEGGFSEDDLLEEEPAVVLQPDAASSADHQQPASEQKAPDAAPVTSAAASASDFGVDGRHVDSTSVLDAPFLDFNTPKEKPQPAPTPDERERAGGNYTDEASLHASVVKTAHDVAAGRDGHTAVSETRDVAVTVHDNAERVLEGQIIEKGVDATSYDDDVASSPRSILVGHPEIMDYVAYQALANVAELRRETIYDRQDENRREHRPENSGMPAPIEVVVADFTGSASHIEHYADRPRPGDTELPRYTVETAGVFDQNGPLSHLPPGEYAEVLSGAVAKTMAKEDTSSRLLMREVVARAVAALQGSPTDPDHNPGIPHIAKVHQAVLTQRPGTLWGAAEGVQSDVPDLTDPEQRRLRDAFPPDRKDEYKTVITPLALWLESAASCAPPPATNGASVLKAEANGHNGPLPMKVRRFELTPGNETAEQFQSDVLERVLPAIVEGRTKLRVPRIVIARGVEDMLESGGFPRLRTKAERKGTKLIATASEVTQETTPKLISPNGVGETLIISRQSSPQAQLITGALPTIDREDGESTSYAIHFAEGGSRSEGDSWSWGQNHVGDDPDGGGRTGGRDRNQSKTGDVNKQFTKAPGPIILPKEVEELGGKELIVVKDGQPPRVFDVVTRRMDRVLVPEDHSNDPVILAARALAENVHRPLAVVTEVEDRPALTTGAAPVQNSDAPKPPTGVGARPLSNWQIEQDARTAYGTYRQNMQRRRERALSFKDFFASYRQNVLDQRGY